MIRNAKPADENEVFGLASALATSFEVERDGFSKAFTSILASKHMILLVEEVDNGLIGYVLAMYHPCFYASGKVAWTEELYVKPEYRSQGIGRALIEAVETWAQQEGCRLSGLATRRASDFYKALGYEESATYFKKTFF